MQTKWTTYALCHLAGMSSACINPVLYGWLNQNLRAELFRLFPRLQSALGKPEATTMMMSFAIGGGGGGGGGLTTMNVVTEAPTEVGSTVV